MNSIVEKFRYCFDDVMIEITLFIATLIALKKYMKNENIG